MLWTNFAFVLEHNYFAWLLTSRSIDSVMHYSIQNHKLKKANIYWRVYYFLNL